MSTFMQYAIAASEEAFSDAGWRPKTVEEQDRTVCPSPFSSHLFFLIALRNPIESNPYPFIHLTNSPLPGHNPRFRHRLPLHPPLNVYRLLLSRPKIHLPILRPPDPHKPRRRAHLHALWSQRPLPRAQHSMHYRLALNHRRKLANRHRGRRGNVGG